MVIWLGMFASDLTVLILAGLLVVMFAIYCLAGLIAALGGRQ